MLENTKIMRKWREYAGVPDERLEAENCKIYRVGFMLLSFGMLLYFVYGLMAQQVAWVHGDAVDATVMFDPLFIWFMIVMVVCTVMQTRKGFVETNRFGQTEKFPLGFFTFVSAASGVASTIAIWAMRCIAEVQIVPADQVFWLANLAVGFVSGVLIFTATLLVFYLQFRAAKSRREKMNRELGVEEDL